MKLLSQVLVDSSESSSDSESEEDALPVNTKFRCVKPATSSETTGDNVLFTLDTVGGEEVEEEVEVMGTSSTTNTRFLLQDDSKTLIKQISSIPSKNPEVVKILQSATVTPSYESSLGSSAVLLSKRALKRQAKLEREKTTGKPWFDMPATELTEERRADLELIAMRAALDPTRHYRKKDRDVLPKYFQVGRVVDDARDFYSGRMTKKERKRNMLEEMMHDKDTVDKNKERFKKLQAQESSKIRGAFQKAKITKKKSDKAGCVYGIKGKNRK